MLHNKSQTSFIFLFLNTLVERKFHTKIQQLHIDRGTEFKSLKTYLFQGGYTIRISCPYTYTHNGIVERRHKYIVEIGLTMMTRPGITVTF